MRQHCWVIIFFSILGLAAYVRMWNLGNVPEGFYSDEALYGYEAYSLLQTGKDQFGNQLPLSIAGFGDYRPAYYIYATIPFIFIFGLTEFATRLPSAIFSIATVVVVFFFIFEITHNKKVSLAGMSIIAISPWSVYFGRMAHETNLMTFLVILGVFFLWRVRICNYCIVGSMVSLAAAVYTYHSARIFVPLFILITVVLFRKDFRKKIFTGIFGMVLFMLLVLPLAFEFNWEGSWSRVKGVSIWTDPGTVSRINELRGNVKKRTGDVVAKIIINKGTIYPVVFLDKFISHFNLKFLLFSGDHNGVYNTPRTGILMWVELLFIIIGSYFLWKRQRNIFYWVLWAVIIGLIPDSLTRTAPSSARIHLLLPFLATISAIGMGELFKKRNINILIVLFISLNCGWFWYHYLLVRPIVHQEAWQIGAKEMVLKTQELSTRYDTIWISRSGWGWIHVLFHTKYDPMVFQKEAKTSPRNDIGFWWVTDIGKYHLEWLPDTLKNDKKILYVAQPEEFSRSVHPFYIIKNKTGKEIYWFVDSNLL